MRTLQEHNASVCANRSDDPPEENWDEDSTPDYHPDTERVERLRTALSTLLAVLMDKDGTLYRPTADQVWAAKAILHSTDPEARA